jgi:hypothetical protein
MLYAAKKIMEHCLQEFISKGTLGEPGNTRPI